MKYAAFISYSHRDTGWASWLHRSLERYRFPKPVIGSAGRDGPVPARLGVVFRDRDELPTSSDLGTAITDALDASSYLIVICSPDAAASRWVNEEVLHFKRTGRENRILPLIVAGEPNGTDKGRPDDECFPRALRFRLGEGGELTDTPMEFVAADARADADGRANAKLKLLAGLVGTDYDNLKQRERRRLQKQRTQLVSGGVTLAAVLGVAGMVALLQSKRASEAEGNVASLSETARQLKERWSGPGVESTPLIDAVLMDDVDALESLAPSTEELNAFWGTNQLTPLMIAMAAGNADATRWLMENGARQGVLTKDHGSAAVHIAVDFNQPAALEAYANAGGDLELPTEWGSRGVDIAANAGNKEVLREFLRLGVPADLDKSRGVFAPLLHVAAGAGHTDIVQMLIEAGASTRVTDSIGRTPLDYAMESGYVETAKLLAAEQGLDAAAVEAKSLDSGLHNVVLNLYAGIVSVSKLENFLSSGANPNSEASSGVSVFAQAVDFAQKAKQTDSPALSREEWFRVLRLMLDHGADNTVNSVHYNQTIRQSLEQSGDTELIELIFGEDGGG